MCFLLSTYAYDPTLFIIVQKNWMNLSWFFIVIQEL